MFYKYSVYKDNGKTFYANVTTERRAIQLIISLYETGNSDLARKMWVRNNETGMLIGIVNKRVNRYTYETTSGRERYVNTDGTFVKKTPKGNQFGLDFYLK